MNYTLIDLNAWKRGKLFDFYLDNLRCVMSMTVDVDVTPLLDFVRKNQMKFYPAMMWAVSRTINAHDEFKYGWNARGELIRWDYISPYYADFRQEDQSFVKLVTEYSADLPTFHARFLSDRERYREYRAFDLQELPGNLFDVSCLPWVKYRSFDLHVFDSGKYLAPVVTWGKYELLDGKAMIPLSMNIHHAVADGFHLCRFFNEVQELIAKIN